MILVFAHAGHWLVQLAYLAPLLALVGILIANQIRERRERRGAEQAGNGATARDGARRAVDETAAAPVPDRDERA